MSNMSYSTVAIAGAGPYGISVAAHLRAAGIDFRIFGKSIQRWRTQMPQGMFLKSEASASNLSDPAGAHTLTRFCEERGLPDGQPRIPVSLSAFTDYALAFQKAMAPMVEDVMIASIDASEDGFELQLANGDAFSAAQVVIATGLENAEYIPPVLGGLPAELRSHTADHCDLSRFKGRDVTVIGGGQSALETAALLNEQGAKVRLVVRKPAIAWNSFPRTTVRSRYEKLRRPASPLGEGLELWLSSRAPMLFRQLPRAVRLARVKQVLGPAGAWWLKQRVLDCFETLTDCDVVKAVPRGSGTVLSLAGPDGKTTEIATDHVIAGTGYRFDVKRLPFLSPRLKAALVTEESQPVLSGGFESSVRGLYFTGLASAVSFGPVMRFLAGTHYTARTLCHNIAAANKKQVESALQLSPKRVES
jgi:hypothetical protein